MGASDGAGQRIGTLGHDDQVDMVVHQAIAQDLNRVPRGLLGQDFEIHSAVIVDEKDRLTIVAALSDVMGDSRSDDACGAGHFRIVSNRRQIAG